MSLKAGQHFLFNAETLVFIYVWIYENEAKGLISRTILRGRFFSPETISKGDDIKIKRIVSPFFFPLPLDLAFTAVLSLFLARFHGLEVAIEFREIKVKKSSRVRAL